MAASSSSVDSNLIGYVNRWPLNSFDFGRVFELPLDVAPASPALPPNLFFAPGELGLKLNGAWTVAAETRIIGIQVSKEKFINFLNLK